MDISIIPKTQRKILNTGKTPVEINAEKLFHNKFCK